jgi:hypothetical protein
VAIAARICPNDVRLTLEQAIPGGMSLEDYLLMREVIAAIREGLPMPTKCSPVRYFSMCSGRCATVRTKTEKRTDLFAQAKFVNDLKGRFYNRVAKSLAFQFCTARSQLKWTREGAAWILLYRRRRMGRVVPDKDHAGMW